MSRIPSLTLLTLLFTVLFAGATAAQPPPAGRCLQDALERWFCASDPNGSAVVDNLGAVVCAPGRCVEIDDDWECASLSGGGAERTPEGAVCEGGCRAPRAVDCELGSPGAGS
jgi:hypothetical protein